MGQAEFLEAKPGTKGLRKTCWLQAYRLPKATKDLRPRDTWRPNEEQRSYLPMLSNQYKRLDMTQAPRHDPLDFAKHTPVANNVKKRETHRATGQGVEKSMAKGKQVKGKKVDKSKTPGSRDYGFRSKTVKK
ncbi:hypothetical protein FOYG_04532 [Fusarium oxysporum NRRL 32931]|uniref:Uncharacterized protein n=1 Tax=Fusarium oxysporum NRRL 32931 TaxID=660029 RepID=W9ILK0_FUSOX|nr:hypothetical protein FOYG_04532 [Fusarium oxysporum NRRL 32931]